MQESILLNRSPSFQKPIGNISGFTLIELSIVLVIIGLIIGGILTGQNLIDAAAQRAQIAQIEKYDTAINTFRNKYGEMPGDMEPKLATQFGFQGRAGTAGRGDNNGELDGYDASTVAYAYNEDGENLLFWEDLSQAGLIDQTLNSYTDGVYPVCITYSTCAIYFPQAKIGNNNEVYAYSGYAANCVGSTCTSFTNIGPNFFGIAIINGSNHGNVTNGGYPPMPGLSPIQAYNMDKKVDDGLPTSGRVMAQYLTSGFGHPGWSANGTTATSTNNCYYTISGVAAYSVGIGAINCGISFQFAE